MHALSWNNNTKNLQDIPEGQEQKVISRNSQIVFNSNAFRGMMAGFSSPLLEPLEAEKWVY